MSSKYYIVYPRGDRSKLTVVEIVDALSYELSDYAVASRQSFYDEEEAVVYAKNLAKDNGLKFIGDNLGIPDYLD